MSSPNTSYPTIHSFQIKTASKEDYDAYHSFVPDQLGVGKHFTSLFSTEMGYNPGSKLGTRQECQICGKGGFECIGHPLVMDMTSLGKKFLSEFGLPTITSITSVICITCKSVVRDKENEVFDLEGLLNLSKQRYACKCEGSIPNLDRIKEEKIEEADKSYEWRDGRKRERRATQLTLTTTTSRIIQLLQETDLSPLRINKENVLNLFYDRLILLPTSVQPMNFKRAGGAGVEEVTKMMELYEKMALHVIYGKDDQLEIELRKLFVGAQNNKFSGTPSHLTACDGKKGLYRGPGLNKRSLGTGRAVLTTIDTTGKSGEIACSPFLMNNLQYILTVAVHNKEFLQSEVGKSVTHLVIPVESSTTNQRLTYKKLTSQSLLKYGDTILKKLVDGDYVAFFRNPTLWRHSLIGYSVKQWQNYCIGLHESNTPGHGADFDGDEGNLMVGADLGSRIETQMMAAMYHLFGGRSGEPVIGIFYNGIVGAYVLSTDDSIAPTLFSFLLNLITQTTRIGRLEVAEEHYKRLAEQFNVPYHSGRTLISMLLPRQLNYTRGDVKIRSGFLIEGSLRSADVSHGLIIAIADVERWKAPYLFIDRGYAMMSAYISTRGLTISARDYVMPGELQMQIFPDQFESKLISVAGEVEVLERSKHQRTKASIDRIEEQIDHKLNKLKELITELLKKGEYRKTNGSVISYMSGARGNVGNIAATVSCVGQIYAGASRYDSKSARNSFYVPRNSVSIFDRNFVRNSYVSGLSPSEVMGVANAARGQAFNTYLGVPISGATSKQVVNHQADIHISDSFSVCKRHNVILDCLYGYGCDSTMVSYRKTALGDLESSVDCLALLEMVNAL